MRPPPDTLYLAGPTGSGKSAVALALARLLPPAAIVNADAFQLYRGIDLLSATPPPEARAEARHVLYGVLDLAESCDAASYAARASAAIRDLRAGGVLPIVVGGSGLYLKALTHGLSPTPPGDPALREQLERLDLDLLVAWLRAIDPGTAARTNLKNRRYVSRNLEICLLAGIPASTLKRQSEEPEPVLSAFVLSRDREDLYRRIEARTDSQFRQGLVEEIRQLEGRPISPTAAKAIGLREVQDLLAGRLTPEACRAAIVQATRRYAKRQETWFRREKAFQSICLTPSETPDSAARRILGRLAPPDLTPGLPASPEPCPN